MNFLEPEVILERAEAKILELKALKKGEAKDKENPTLSAVDAANAVNGLMDPEGHFMNTEKMIKELKPFRSLAPPSSPTQGQQTDSPTPTPVQA